MTDTTAPPRAELSFEDRLMLIDAAMTVALDQAAVAYGVNTAYNDTEPVDLTDVVNVTTPDPVPQPLPDRYLTPVAALLQRAHYRLLTGGWCSGALVAPEGARCLLGAIHAEARGDHSLEDSAINVLLDAIRRQFGDDADSVPAFNDAWGHGRVPMRMLDQAAGLADARGL
ncbi:DUF6197 family protein [Streptomyces sp. GS7]|uniref:DUF6197 family protein n=1 Tax=Streptomyces sp. GS7 TaxID=2692234 RepID=UPI0013192EC5|nr:hypothetical protein [Streptomyces sp. GS7]QHC23238.1 hypothetical protein GR130_19335 [Streptomyces sp. GS7]